MQDISDSFAEEWKTPSEAFMQGIEATIATNPGLFPLLSKYYQV